MIPEGLANVLGAAVSVAVVRGTLVFLAALVVTALVRRLPAEARHLVWLGVIASFVLIPLAWLALPALPVDSGILRGQAASWRLAAAPALSRVEYTQVIERTSVETVLTLKGAALVTRLVPVVLVSIWLAGVVVLAGRLLVAAVRLRRVARGGFVDERVRSSGTKAAAGLSVRRRVPILLSTRCPMPFSFGWIRPVVMLPWDSRSWPANKLRSVLTHELAHVQRGDILIQSAAYAVCLLFWFAPPVWLAYAALLREAETCCDQQVIARGIRAPEYARSILDLVRSCGGRMLLPCSSAALGKKRMLNDRIRRLLELRPASRPFGVRDSARVAVVCLCCLLPVLALFGQARSQPIPKDDPFFGTWVNTEVDAGERFDIAKYVVQPNGHVLEYRHIAEKIPVCEEWKTVEKAWVDAQGWHQYRVKYVSWLYPSTSGKQEGYARVRISPDGDTREWVCGQYDYPAEVVPLGPGYGIAYRQR